MLTSFNQVHLISNTWLCHCRLSPPVVAPAFSRYLSRSPSTFCYSIPFPRLSKCDHEWSLTNFFHQWAWSLETLGRPVCRPSTIKLSIWTLALPLYTARLLTRSCGSVVQVFCVQVQVQFSVNNSLTFKGLFSSVHNTSGEPSWSPSIYTLLFSWGKILWLMEAKSCHSNPAHR